MGIKGDLNSLECNLKREEKKEGRPTRKMSSRGSQPCEFFSCWSHTHIYIVETYNGSREARDRGAKLEFMRVRYGGT